MTRTKVINNLKELGADCCRLHLIVVAADLSCQEFNWLLFDTQLQDKPCVKQLAVGTTTWFGQLEIKNDNIVKKTYLSDTKQ